VICSGPEAPGERSDERRAVLFRPGAVGLAPNGVRIAAGGDPHGHAFREAGVAQDSLEFPDARRIAAAQTRREGGERVRLDAVDPRDWPGSRRC